MKAHLAGLRQSEQTNSVMFGDRIQSRVTERSHDAGNYPARLIIFNRLKELLSSRFRSVEPEAKVPIKGDPLIGGSDWRDIFITIWANGQSCEMILIRLEGLDRDFFFTDWACIHFDIHLLDHYTVEGVGGARLSV